MDHFYIITNYQKDPAGDTALAIQEYLEERGKVCYVHKTLNDGPRKNQAGAKEPEKGGKERIKEEIGEKIKFHYTDADKIPPDVEGVLVIGGDGTLLRAARDVVDRQLPLLGINMGTLGYLAEIECGSFRTAMDRLLAGEYQVEPRMMICGEARRHGRRIFEDIALNDIVITRNGRLRIVDFNVFVNKEFLKSYSADGVIISTPTGSTGYNLSAGGPIVAPQASLLLLTAIAPHTLCSRPIVLPGDAEITIEIGSSHGTDIDGAEATFDGDTSVKLSSGDQITIRRSEQKTMLIRTMTKSFLEILREKMNR